MKKLHLALGVADIEASVAEYTKRLDQEPALVIPGNYALWRTSQLNVSIRNTGSEEAGKLRHLGWETEDAEGFTSETDCNGIIWERFAARHQAQEIHAAWPSVAYEPKD